MRAFSIFVLLFFIIFNVNSQIVESGVVKYGNEWIDYNKDYYKIQISEDGIYHITYQQLVNSGLDIDNIEGKDFKLFVYGVEVPLYLSTEGKFGSTDYIEFYGEKNRSQLDYFLYRDKGFIFNPDYSLFTDIATYFLTIEKNSPNKRFTPIDNDLTSGLPSVEEYYIEEAKLVNTESFVKPLRDHKNHIYKSNFDIGEGFGTKLQKINTFKLNTSNFINIGKLPILNVRYTTNLGSHKIRFHLNNKFLKEKVNKGFTCRTEKFNVPFNEMKPVMDLKVEGTDDSDYTDRNSVSIISLKYTREFKFLNKSYYKFNIEKSSFTKYIEVQDFDVAGSSFVLYDVVSGTRQIPVVENNLVKFKLLPSDTLRKLVLVNMDKSTKEVNKIEKINFFDYLQVKDKNYIIVSDKDRFVDESGKNWVDEYSNYRSSVEGGSHKTYIVNIHDIYDQFGYGVDRHVIGLNNFLIYLKDKFINPEYIFIIGKAIEYSEIRTEEQRNNLNNLFFVPTYGYPGSDNLLVARYKKDYPVLPIGRIAARDYNGIEKYLNKVKRHEDYLQYSQTQEDKEWMRKVIHLVGGSSDIINQIESYMRTMAYIANRGKLGADVHTYKRTSGNAQQSVTERIVDDIEEGAGIITFYGHSGIGGTDFNIENLQNDRYPVFYSLGCYSGNIHTSVENGQSEAFVLDDHGVLVYAGTSGTGFTGSLGNLGKKIYEYTGGELYGEGLGKIIQKAIKVLGENNFDIGTVTLDQQFTFHGDPAVSLYKHPGPDYLIDYTSIITNPAIINSNSPDFKFEFDVLNIGVGIKDSLVIKVLRKLPKGTVDTTYTKIKAPTFKSKVSITLPTFNIDGIGENHVSVFLDPQNAIQELPSPDAEGNNILSNPNTGENDFSFYIVNNGVKPIYPEEFAIIGNKDIKLQASSFNFFIEPQNYIFQIDTTELFNSPSLKTSKVLGEGGIIEWKPEIDFQHNQVYYWRISPDSLNQSLSYLWQNSSFVYLQNSTEGWNQSHYFQYLKDEFDGTEFIGRRLSFNKKRYSIKIKGQKYNPSSRKIAFIDGETWGEANPLHRRPCINILAWGPDNWYRNITGHDYGSLQNQFDLTATFTYKTNTQDQRKGIKDLLENIPDSTTVYIYTILGNQNQSLNPETWAQDSIDLGYNLFSVLEKYGAKKIRLMETKGTVPYIFIFKKGFGVLHERIGKTINDVFEVEQDVTINNPKGKLHSKVIGPVKKWKDVLWNERWDKPSEDDLQYYSYLKVYKMNREGEEILVDSLNTRYELDISSIEAKDYPYLKFEYFAYDRRDRRPPILNYWRVHYDGVADAVLVNDDRAYFYKDTLDYGDIFKFKTKVFNNTPVDMDSLLVKFKIKKQNNEEVIINKKFGKLLGNSEYFIEFEYPSNEIQGLNEFSVELNPNKDQYEKYYFNNIGIKRFYVKKDTENPIMDVTFNGTHIMDGDIINPRTQISIMLNDNNKFLLLNDKSIYKNLTIIYPSGTVHDIDINSDTDIEFIPAESIDNNVAKLVYSHDFITEDGEYQLIVQASDISGNLSGENEYKISFKVNSKEQISSVYNYPNPFTTSTKFVFNITGIDPPENIVIKIMTLSGKIVRELTNVDLGDLDIGQNITKKSWDGTDEYGRKLANGIYLYQVKAVNSEGKEFEAMEENFDGEGNSFKKGFGKLVILR